MEDLLNQNYLHFNGISGATGLPVIPAQTLAEVADTFAMMSMPKALAVGYSSNDVGAAGWALVLPQQHDRQLMDAFDALLNHRRGQTKVGGGRFDILDYIPGESKFSFLSRHGFGPGTVDPKQFPYFLLLVGDIDQIPLNFQYQLSQQYAVGRVSLDRLEDYERYARTLSKEGVASSEELVVFAPQHPGDYATTVSVESLAKPLGQQLAKDHDNWTVRSVLAHQASRSRFLQVLRDRPALLFSFSHGMCYDSADERYQAENGALLCSEWPGQGPPTAEMVLCAQDLPQDVDLSESICWLHACSSGGVSGTNPFGDASGARPLIGALPKAMMALPSGPARAVIAHMDTTYSYGFAWDGFENRTTYLSALKHLMLGEPIGSAMRHFHTFYAELATALVSDSTMELELKTLLRSACLDLQGYILFGDPAASISVPGPR